MYKTRSLKLVFVSWIILQFVGTPLFAQKIPVLGMASSIDNDSLLYSSGFKLIGESVSKMLSPSLNASQLAENISRVKKAKCKLYMCNVLFPPSLKIAGPDVDEKRVLGYLDSVSANARKAGIPVLVLGSGGARKLPESYDRKKAKVEFIALAKKMAEVAEKNKTTIVLENLNSTETNFLNKLKEAAEVVSAVNHKNFRLNADIYHMLKENESPREIVKAGDIIVYCEVAEKDERTLPGVKGEDFRAYFSALKTINYLGPIIIEGKTGDIKKDAATAYLYLTKQLKECYSKPQ